MAKKRILTQDEIDRYMNNWDELSEDGLEYSDDDVDFLPDCVSSNEDSDSDCENKMVHKMQFRMFCAYKLELHSGQENNEKYRQKGEPDLGASANVHTLSKEGIINRNIISNSKIRTEKVFNKMERRHSMEFVGNYNDVEISVTAWETIKL
ncbi:piggyBac transposable element-derived protein 3 [Trichonephila clavata]|uniref:PiggyBac transposable element-derived protein 3 n=1 Tax=Trichonephila clavata TaxID=2740835 RepID=A0A8X6KBL6_TRICU|nr:piggyBac transposable element-derived protein 3 [Trichonephila clavata]